MKKAIIWIILVIVIALAIAGGIYLYSSNNNNPNVSGDKGSGDVTSGDNEFVDNTEYLYEVDNITNEISEAIISGDGVELNTYVTEKEIGSDATEFMNTLNLDSISATVRKYQDKGVSIYPTSDHLNAQEYYYQDGELILYKYLFMGVGGYTNYYFKDGRLIEIVERADTEMIDRTGFADEKEEDILKKSKNVYERFINDKYYSMTLPDDTNVPLGFAGDIEDRINENILRDETYDTDWPNTAVRAIDFENISIKILLNEEENLKNVINISTTSEEVIVGEGARVGNTLEVAQAFYDNRLEKAEIYYDEEVHGDMIFDLAYVYDEGIVGFKTITFYIRNNVVMGIDILDALDG